ncbi:nucleolin-like [Chanodichthys erythropterus]|uniref:nucleolin-like n=1 Tax=Chanodichthys erythropterus TaxID=933992 RepID=UPI00351F7E7A
MKAQMDVICCKSVGTDLSMLDIEDFISEICQLKKEVASLEAKLRERGDKPNREDLEKVSVCVTDRTEAQDSVWRSRDTQDSELSLTLLCYTDAQDHGSADQTSDCNAGEQQTLQTPLKMCSVKLVDCRNLIKTTAEEQQQRHEEEEEQDGNNDDEDGNNEDDGNDEDDDEGSRGEKTEEEQQQSHAEEDEEE